MTIEIFNTNCPSCFEAVYPAETKQAITHGDNLVLQCGHVMHLHCYRDGEHNVAFKNHCWVCKKDIDLTQIPQLTALEKCKNSWRRGFDYGFAHAGDIASSMGFLSIMLTAVTLSQRDFLSTTSLGFALGAISRIKLNNPDSITLTFLMESWTIPLSAPNLELLKLIAICADGKFTQGILTGMVTPSLAYSGSRATTRVVQSFTPARYAVGCFTGISAAMVSFLQKN